MSDEGAGARSVCPVPGFVVSVAPQCRFHQSDCRWLLTALKVKAAASPGEVNVLLSHLGDHYYCTFKNKIKN